MSDTNDPPMNCRLPDDDEAPPETATAVNLRQTIARLRIKVEADEIRRLLEGDDSTDGLRRIDVGREIRQLKVLVRLMMSERQMRAELAYRIVTGDGVQLENVSMNDAEWQESLDAHKGDEIDITIDKRDWLALIAVARTQTTTTSTNTAGEVAELEGRIADEDTALLKIRRAAFDAGYYARVEAGAWKFLKQGLRADSGDAYTAWLESAERRQAGA